MKFLFFIPLLLAVVSGLPLEKLMKDPASLIQNLESVDPNAIAELQDYVVQLIKEGVADEAMYTQNRDDAIVAANNADAALADALSALNSAKAIHEAATSKEADKNEQARLNREKALFEEIKGLLTKVKATVEVG